MAGLQQVRVKDSTIILVVNIGLEAARYELYQKILNKLGTRKVAREVFPYGEYRALDPAGRGFDNAMATVRRHKLRYVEGVLLFDTDYGRFPLGHAWCETKEGKIIDPTCHKYQGTVNAEYYGVPIKPSYSEGWKKAVGYYGCLDGDKEGRPIGVYHEPPEKWHDPIKLKLIAKKAEA